MIESTGVDVATLMSEKIVSQWTYGNVHYLLGYNEPDQIKKNQFRELPAEAAKHWITVQQAAQMFDPPLTLVSPAPESSDVTDDGESAWLTQFFGNCTQLDGCEPDLIEHIAYHNYVGDIDQLNSTIYGMAKNYPKSDGSIRPLWLTELGVGRYDPPDGPPLSEKITYIQKLLPFLDSHPLIYRYAWFTARHDPNIDKTWGGPTSLLPWNNTGLTP